MKCIWCNERKGNTRCEGCQQLFCLPCMTKHLDELEIQFDLLFGVQNELKESFNIVESIWQNKKELSCLNEIDRWEQEVINRIQQIATKARITANEMMTKNMKDIRRRLDQLVFDMQQRQTEGNYLDNDITAIRNQLEQLNKTIKTVNDKIQVDYTMTNNIDWGSLMYVTTGKKVVETRSSLPEFDYEEENHQDKLWTNLKKLIRSKHTSNEYKNKQSNFKPNTSSLFEPIVLTSYDSTICSVSEKNVFPTDQSFVPDRSQLNSFSNDQSFNQITFTSINRDQQVSYASEV